MTKRTLTIALLLALLLVMLAPVHAQFDDDELEAIELVSAALENVNAVTTVQMEGEMVISQVISTQGFTLENAITQDLIGGWQAADGLVEAMSMILDQEVVVTIPGQADTTGTMRMEMILIEDSLYLRISETGGALAGMFPDGWFDLAEGEVPAGLETLNTEGMLEQVRAMVQYPINEETVDAIEELEPETLLDDREARVFEVVFDVDALAETEAFAANLNSVDLEALGVDGAAALDALLENAAMSMTVWIGVDDGIIYRADTELLMDVDLADMGIPGVTSGTLVQVVTTSIVYSGFDKPFEIEAPDL